MLLVSQKFKKAMREPVKELQAYLSTGDTKISDSDNLISFKISCESGMCKTAMRKLEAKYLGELNLIGQWVHVGYGVKIDDGTFEYLDYGSFLVTEMTHNKDSGITTITAYDKMISAMVEYKKLDISYPINLLDYTKALCNNCNLEFNDMLATATVDINEGYLYVENLDLELDTETGCLMSYETDLEIIDGYLYGEKNKHSPLFNLLVNQELWENISGITYRDIFVQIAQATGTTCIVSNDDKILFKSLKETRETLTYDNMFKLKLEPKYGEINSVVLSRTPQEDNIYMRDEDSIGVNGLTEFKIENNELLDKDRDNVISSIYDVLHGISYYPFETTTEGLGWYEIADSFNIVNDTGDVYNTSLFNFTINIDGSIKETLKTVADTKPQTQYQYATSLAKRIKNTEIIVNKQEQYIESIVSDIHDEDGVVNSKFTKVYQDIENIVNNVQDSGGNNLIKNSVMFAYDNENIPNWYITNRNLFKLNTSISGYINEDNTITAQDSTNKERTSDYIDVSYLKKLILNLTVTVPSGGYIWWAYLYYDESKKPISERVSLHNQPNSITINVPANAKYIRVSTRFYDNGVLKIEPVGDLIIDSNTESINAGCLSGHSFTLLDKIASQRVYVTQGNSYTFSTRIKKDVTGNCYIKLFNNNESYLIQLNSGESAFYKEYTVSLVAKDTFYKIEFYGSLDSNATFTDNMLATGEYKSQWTQANGEIMNTQVNVNVDGVLVKSSVYLGDYTVMSPLEFAGYSNINGTITKVFSLNKDVTLVKKLEAEDEVKMVPIKIVPVTSGELQGWAFVPST